MLTTYQVLFGDTYQVLTSSGEKKIKQNTEKSGQSKKQKKKSVHILEAHSALSAKIVEEAGYDGIWSSSLCDSALRAMPDTELVSIDDRLETIRQIRYVTDLPIIMDCDTGGPLEHLKYQVRKTMEAGVDMIVLEDKQFPKKNSLDKEAGHILEDVDKFCAKIKAIKEMGGVVAARLESLIAKKSIFDALLRAAAYVEAGADAILIHSKKEVSADEVMEFAERFKKEYDTPLIAIPSTYDLPEDHPFDIVIHANHLMRASLKAMKETAKTLKTDNIATVKELLKAHE